MSLRNVSRNRSAGILAGTSDCRQGCRRYITVEQMHAMKETA